MTIVHCPTCQKEVVWSKTSLFRPFCSDRCRLIDLGSWADGSYAIPSNIPPEEDEEVSNHSEENYSFLKKYFASLLNSFRSNMHSLTKILFWKTIMG